jgi:hypothetical protein
MNLFLLNARRTVYPATETYPLTMERQHMITLRALVAFLFAGILAGCVEEPIYKNDISEANRMTVCPVDVSEADRAEYPACN